ncbi:MAG: DUF512 domain-containing protein [Oscillospiraceae bacterium]
MLDFDFYIADEKLKIDVIKANGKHKIIRINKEEYEDIGLEFETYLIDKQRSCRNNCMFCFVDQMPIGMRESLYFKDDDDRLSFIFGNYVTLTNLPQEEIDRIIKMHISPINISVHTTNPELRVKMMNNRFAGEVLSYIDQLANAGIKLNCQLVLCPDVNDGEELKRSLRDLSKLFPSVQTIACVPVGLTKHRENLPHLEPYTKEKAEAVIDIIHDFSKEFFEENGTHLAFPADEFYVKAQREISDADYYGEFTQLENGVGIVALQRSEFIEALVDIEESDTRRRVTVATGVDAKPYIEKLVDELKKKWHNLECNVIAVENEFFGKTITVAGLVTGQDILATLDGIDLGDELILPSCMLRHEQDKFLDDITLDELKTKLSINVRLCDNDGYDVLNALIGAHD